MPISFSRKFWPNFSRGEKDLALSAAMTIPSMVFSLGPCMRTVNSEVVGSAPARMGMRTVGTQSPLGQRPYYNVSG